MAAVRKGQAFIIGALIFTALSLLVLTTSLQDFTTADSEAPRRFYERALLEVSEPMNQEIDSDYSIKTLTREIYGFNSFVERRAAQKGMEYNAVQIIVVPDSNKARLINYREKEKQFNLSINGDWKNKSVKSGNWLESSFTGEKATVKIIIPSESYSKEFDAYSPRLFHRVEISDLNEIWVNQRIF